MKLYLSLRLVDKYLSVAGVIASILGPDPYEDAFYAFIKGWMK